MATQNKTTRERTSLVAPHSQNYAAGIRGHYHGSSDCFEYPKKSLLKSSHPKKYLPNFPTQKNPGMENFKPKKSFDHPRHLKSGEPPLGLIYNLTSLTRHALRARSYPCDVRCCERVPCPFSVEIGDTVSSRKKSGDRGHILLGDG